MADTKVDVITEKLRQQILKGDFGTLGRLPSLRMLADQYDTARETMNKVVQQLQAEGLLISRGTGGVFVAYRTRLPAGITARFDLYLKQQGLTPVETDIEKPSLVPASPEAAEVFGIAEGTSVVRRYRRQGTTETHYRLTENFYSTDLVDEAILKHMQDDVSFDVLLAIKAKYGKAVKYMHERVIGRLPTLQEQELLKIIRNSPVLDVHRTSRADDEKRSVIMFSHIIYIASYFELSYDYTVPYWTEEKQSNKR
jgi:DNA-binding GntR family transcriptional regulator